MNFPEPLLVERKDELHVIAVRNDNSAQLPHMVLDRNRAETVAKWLTSYVAWVDEQTKKAEQKP